MKDKIQRIDNLLDIVDEMIIGGRIAYTFLKTLQVMEVSECVWIAPVNPTVQRLFSKLENRQCPTFHCEWSACADGYYYLFVNSWLLC